MNIPDILTGQQGALEGFFRSRGFSPEDAEDLVQETLYRALKNEDDVRDKANPEGWLFAIARNVAIDQSRRAAHRTTEPLAPEIEPGEESEPINATCRCVLRVIDQLPGDQARLIRLVDLEETPQSITAAQLDIPRNTLKVQVFRARKQLREMLEATCGACAAGSHCLDCSCGV